MCNLRSCIYITEYILCMMVEILSSSTFWMEWRALLKTFHVWPPFFVVPIFVQIQWLDNLSCINYCYITETTFIPRATFMSAFNRAFDCLCFLSCSFYFSWFLSWWIHENAAKSLLLHFPALNWLLFTNKSVKRAGNLHCFHTSFLWLYLIFINLINE